MKRRIAVGILQTACLLGVLTSNLLASDMLDTWKWRNPIPNGNNFNGVTYAGGLIVGVGDWGTIMTSPDLTSARWVQSPLGTNVQSLRAITYAPDKGTFVTVGYATGVAFGPGNAYKAGTILTSTDATNWYAQSWTNTNTRNLNGVAYGAGRFAAVGQRGGIWSSPDGTNWTQTLADQSSKYNLNAITYRPDVGFVAVGDAVSSLAQVETSPDGITWTLRTTGVPASSFQGITWGYVTNLDSSISTNFVGVGSSGTISTSPDGITWFSQISGTTSKLYGTAFGPGVGYIAVGAGATIQTSPDGTNWFGSYSEIDTINVPGNDFAGATYALGYFIGVGGQGEVETSPTGGPGTWTAEFFGRPENLYGIARGNVNFVAVGLNIPNAPQYALALTSSDGSNWKVRNSGTPSGGKLRNIAYGAGNFVAVGDAGMIVSSASEGTNWAQQAAGFTAYNLSGVSYLTNSITNIFLAAGATGTILTSPDGTNWTAQTSGVNSNLYCSACGANIFVVGGAGGVLLTSPDGTTWTSRNSANWGKSKDINGIAYSAANSTNNFVAVGGSGGIWTSPDGINWTARSTAFGTSPTFQTIAYGNDNFVVGASSASTPILTSTDAVTWITNRYSPASAYFRAIAYTANTFVGVGSGGMILQAGAIVVPQPQLHYSYAGGTLTLTWSGGGILQAASPNVAGPYTNVPGASTPWPVTPLSEPGMYFRLQQP